MGTLTWSLNWIGWEYGWKAEAKHAWVSMGRCGSVEEHVCGCMCMRPWLQSPVQSQTEASGDKGDQLGDHCHSPCGREPLHWGSSCWPDVEDILKEGLIGFDDRLTVRERKILGWREEAEGEFAGFSPSSPA